MHSLVASSFNLILLLALLHFKLRRPLLDYVASRHETIKEDIHSVRDQLRNAHEKYDEITAKLKAIDAEVSTLREQSKQDTAAMKQRIVGESRKMMNTLVADAKVAAESLYSDLKGQLYFELSSRVLERAESILRDRLTGEDRARFRDEFSQMLGSVQ